MTQINPFDLDADRAEIWDMLVVRDVEAFVAGDWAATEVDFLREGFLGINARGTANPDSWNLGYGSLDAYRDSWLQQSREFTETMADPRSALYSATTLRDIDISGAMAVAHKKFDGTALRLDGSTLTLDWQSLYFCQKTAEGWKIRGFLGYLPSNAGHPAGGPAAAVNAPAKTVPAGAGQHVTAGPYSPVLQVAAGQLTVISGQAAILPDGTVEGRGIAEQTRLTLANCATQLATAGCTLADVFKVNVYMADLNDWEQFNEIYRQVMPEPRPVRTAVGVDLLPGLVVEVEMWAAKRQAPAAVAPAAGNDYLQFLRQSLEGHLQ